MCVKSQNITDVVITNRIGIHKLCNSELLLVDTLTEADTLTSR